VIETLLTNQHEFEILSVTLKNIFLRSSQTFDAPSIQMMLVAISCDIEWFKFN